MSAIVAHVPDMPLLPTSVGIGLMALAIVLTLILAPNASKARELRAEGGDHGQQRARMSLWSAIKAMDLMWKQWNRSRFAIVISFCIYDLCISGQATLSVPYAYRRFGWTSNEDGYFQAVAFFAEVLVMIAFLHYVHRAKNRWRSQLQSHEQEQEQEQEQQPRSSDPESAESEMTPALSTSSDCATSSDSARGWLRPWTARYPMEAWVAQVGFLTFAIAQHFDVLSTPSVRSLLTRTVPASLVGTLIATFSVTHSLAYILAPVVFNAVYATTVGIVDGAAYNMGAAMWAIALALSLAVQHKDLVARGPDTVVTKIETEKTTQEEVALNAAEWVEVVHA
ncbi:hypothetical protein AMAG_06910 [Allomyces macrogynus ATCC 38327]|uniref:Uncharacterized protein n=1 Tax=Allomyces macrogynus (strain ATCC 38327) TaxID=578462 RepID=A0A0L0SFL3_ALLM3|nr:hypothetical protein AMAG_06910 [Allomyces macrogynus ATCC 38327]|eukprot:KNE61160.1 hypothetical protein AMAG_06910 [Allomyces macrogynus ATCC 38327]